MQWKRWPKTLSRVEIFENSVFVFSCGQWKHSVGSRLPQERAGRKTSLNAKWRRIPFYKKIQNIEVLCLAWFTIDIFGGLRDFIIDCNFKKQLHFVICQKKKRVGLAFVLRSTGFLSWSATSLNYFLANFQIPKEDRHCERTTMSLRARSVSGVSVFVWTGENDSKTLRVDANVFENGEKQFVCVWTGP